MPICALNVLKQTFSITSEIYDRYQGFSENNEHRQRVLQRIKELQRLAEDLKNSGIDELPASSIESVEAFQESIKTCKRICDNLHSKGILGKVISVRDHKVQLEALEKELEKAQSSFQLALTKILLVQNQSLKQSMLEGHAQIQATVIHPSVGVYQGAGTSNKLSRPFPIMRPEVTVNEELMVVKWCDYQNPADVVDRYEVRYDDQIDLIIPGEPKDFKVSNESNEFALSIGPPKIIPGQLYTIQVRAVNSQGPSEWSDERVFRYKIGPPNKPKQPQVFVNSPTEVIVKVKKLEEEETNGSPVHQCVVEWIADDPNSSEWQRLTCPLERHRDSDTIKLSIKQLIPDTMYRFRVKMVNEAGESHPSDVSEALTKQMIPGPPQELRVSSKRTDTSIKIRWKPPTINPQAVDKYEVQLQLMSNRQPGAEWETFVTVPHTKLSATARGLRSDTKYQFRVRAINNDDQNGEFSDSLVTETRFGKLGRGIATVGAFVGATVGGPLMGAVSIGYLAGSSAESGPDSKVGKKVAAVAGGVGGGIGGFLLGIVAAPLFGGVGAAMTYKALEGGLEEQSPQSSEDEEEESMFREIWKISKKKSEGMMMNKMN